MMKNRFLTAIMLSILFGLGGMLFGTGMTQAWMDGTEMRNSSDHKGSQPVMPASHPLPVKIADLVKSARTKSGGVVSEQHRQSLPVPVFRNGNLLIAFLYCPALALPKQSVKMSPPQYLVLLRPDTGSLVELKAVAPRDFGQTHKPGEMIGTYALLAGMTSDQVLQATDRLYRLYDLLLPGFYARPMSAGQEIIKAAKEFKELFRLLSESPLQPYYRFWGKDFFNWIDQVSGTQ
jgi:hypothetical protein